MNLSDVKDVELSTDEKSNCIKYYYLVCYDTSTGLWNVDDDAIYLPETPIYDPKIDRWRKIYLDEITRDNELVKILRKTIRWIKDA